MRTETGDLVLDWYWPGLGIITDVIDDDNTAPVLLKVFFYEPGLIEYRYTHDIVVIGKRSAETKEDEFWPE